MSDEAILRARARRHAAAALEQDGPKDCVLAVAVVVSDVQVWVPAEAAVAVREVLITALPTPVGALVGVAIVGARSVAVVDLAYLLNLPLTPLTAAIGLVLVLEHEGRAIAVPVEQASAAEELDRGRFYETDGRSPPALARPSEEGSLLLHIPSVFAHPGIVVGTADPSH